MSMEMEREFDEEAHEPQGQQGGATAEAPTPEVVQKIQDIKDLTAAGFPLIPLRGKIPSIKEWGKTPVGKFGVPELSPEGVNYGVVLSENDIVVDVDPRNFKNGDDSLKRLKADIHDDLDKTFTVKTGGGGYHVYFTKPTGMRDDVSNSIPKYPGIEFKSFRRQVVGPGSIHPDAPHRRYVSLSGPNYTRPQDIRTIPGALFERIKKSASSIEGKEGVKEKGISKYKEDADTIRRFTDYLTRTAPLSVQGNNGDRTAFQVAATAHDLGLSPRKAYALMSEQWNERCTPPWDMEELKAKVINSYKYSQNALGNLSPESTLAPITDQK